MFRYYYEERSNILEGFINEIRRLKGEEVNGLLYYDGDNVYIQFLPDELQVNERYTKRVKIQHFEIELIIYFIDEYVAVDWRRTNTNAYALFTFVWKFFNKDHSIPMKALMKLRKPLHSGQTEGIRHSDSLKRTYLERSYSYIKNQVHDFVQIEYNPFNVSDATLMCEGKEFAVCKSIVGPWSNVLHTLFQRGSKDNVYHVECCRANELETLLTYVKYKHSDYSREDVDTRMRTLDALETGTVKIMSFDIETKLYLEEFIIDNRDM